MVCIVCSQIHEKMPLKWLLNTLKKLLLKSIENMKFSAVSFEATLPLPKLNFF